MNRFQFVADHQRRYGVKRLCSILGIARSSFYYCRRRPGRAPGGRRKAAFRWLHRYNTRRRHSRLNARGAPRTSVTGFSPIVEALHDTDQIVHPILNRWEMDIRLAEHSLLPPWVLVSGPVASVVGNRVTRAPVSLPLAAARDN
ncbi:hypothetical protein ACWF94_16940 [Streptomyces sp. NPDC055078]